MPCILNEVTWDLLRAELEPYSPVVIVVQGFVVVFLTVEHLLASLGFILPSRLSPPFNLVWDD